MPVLIEICPREPRATACTPTGEAIKGSEYEQDMLACTVGGDASGPCEYVLDHVGVEFRIVICNAAGDYENRIATPQEKQATCEAIFFESETDFSNENTANLYLVWEAATNLED